MFLAFLYSGLIGSKLLVKIKRIDRYENSFKRNICINIVHNIHIEIFKT